MGVLFAVIPVHVHAVSWSPERCQTPWEGGGKGLHVLKVFKLWEESELGGTERSLRETVADNLLSSG